MSIEAERDGVCLKYVSVSSHQVHSGRRQNDIVVAPDSGRACAIASGTWEDREQDNTYLDRSNDAKDAEHVHEMEVHGHPRRDVPAVVRDVTADIRQEDVEQQIRACNRDCRMTTSRRRVSSSPNPQR